MSKTQATVTHSRCKCSGCGEFFSGLTAFDKHRRGGVCADPEYIGLEIKSGPGGTWWGYPAPADSEWRKTS